MISSVCGFIVWGGFSGKGMGRWEAESRLGAQGLSAQCPDGDLGAWRPDVDPVTHRGRTGIQGPAAGQGPRAQRPDRSPGPSGRTRTQGPADGRGTQGSAARRGPAAQRPDGDPRAQRLDKVSWTGT